MRRQALALMESGKWVRSIDVVLGVSALGNVHPADALILEHCYRGRGERDDGVGKVERTHGAHDINCLIHHG